MKSLFYHICILFIIYSELSNGKPSKPRQFNNLSFAIPALNLLGGGGNNAGTGAATGGNIFRQATVTRTIIRTVSTIAQGVPRTCTAALPVAAMFPPCPGRRRRSAGADELDKGENVRENNVAAEPSIMVVIGTTSITDQVAVSQLLNLGLKHDNNDEEHPLLLTTFRSLNDEEDLTTKLYPSGDSSDNLNDEIYSGVTEGSNSDTSIETQVLDVTILQNFDEISALANESEDSDGRAGFNFAGTTTSTVTISITAVTTSYVSGPASVTLTVNYAGCSPSSFPVSGTPC